MEIQVPVRELIILLRKDGKNYFLRTIDDIVTKSHSAVQYIINKYQKTKVENRKRTGRST